MVAHDVRRLHLTLLDGENNTIMWMKRVLCISLTVSVKHAWIVKKHQGITKNSVHWVRLFHTGKQTVQALTNPTTTLVVVITR